MKPKAKPDRELIPLNYNPIYKQITNTTRAFVLEVGIFKTFGFFASIGISLQCLSTIQTLTGAFGNGLLSAGEYCSCVFGCCIMLLIISLYELYFVDIGITFAFKSDGDN